MVLTILFIILIIVSILLVKRVFDLPFLWALLFGSGGMLFVFWDKIRFGRTLLLNWWDIGKLLIASMVVFACLYMRANIGKKRK